MKSYFRAALAAAASVAMAVCASAQAASPQANTAPPGGEKTVEEAYLQESAEITMVKELSRSDSKDGKLVALVYARRAMDAGRKSDEIRDSLRYLALEYNQVIIRSAGLGPAINNFPDVRAKACEYLGEFPSVASKDTLIRVLQNNRVEDSIVLAEAIRSLGKIGMNDNDEAVQAIANAVDRFSILGTPEDRLAVYALFAFMDIAEKNNGIKNMALVSSTIMRFTQGSYVAAVRTLAVQTLDKLSRYSAKDLGKKG